MGSLISQPEEDESDYDEDSYDDWQSPEQSPAKEEEEPLDLSALSEELIHTIVERMDYKEYSQLEETSKSMARILNNREYSLPHFTNTVFVNKKTVKLEHPNWYYTPKIPWHVATGNGARINTYYVDINCRASSGRMKAVAKLFEKNKTTATLLLITEHVTFEPEDLNRLIKVLGVKRLDCRQFLARKFFMNPEDVLNKMENIVFHTNGCTDEEFLKFKVPCFRMTNDFITDRGLNRFLKQWKKGQREIIWCSIEFGGTFGTRNFDTILEGLDANLIWTPDMHSHSLIRAIKLEDFAPMQTGDPEHLYSMWRVDSPDKIRLLSLSQDCLNITGIDNEASYLLDRLNDDQFYVVMKTCLYCQTEFCYHRGRYSTQRVKKSYPWVYDAVISGIKAAGEVLVTARCVQRLIGASPSHFPLSNSDDRRVPLRVAADHSLFNTVMHTIQVYFLN